MKSFHVFQLACLVFFSAAAMKTTDFSKSIPMVDDAATKKGMEKVLLGNAAIEMEEVKEMPDPEKESKKQGLEGMGGLGRNLEFMMMKLAQLETMVELQQVQIEEMNKWRHGHMSGEHNATQPRPSASEVQLAAEAQAKQAQDTLKNIFQKHQRQRETRTFAKSASERQTPQPVLQPRQTPQTAAKTAASGGATRAQLLQRSERRSEEDEEERSLDDAVSSKWNPVDTFTSGTGMIGNALGDAYKNAKDPIAFVQNTVIDTVEMAMDILSRGFSDFKAGCSPRHAPSLAVSDSGFAINFGRQKCWFRLMGQTVTLFDFNFGRKHVSWPGPIQTAIRFGKGLATCGGGFGDLMKCVGIHIANAMPPLKAVLTMGDELRKCAKRSGADDVIKCLGFRIVSLVPPLSYLNRMSDMLSEYLEGFARTAATVASQALRDGYSLIQDASVSTFPEAGAAPIVKHETRNFMIQTHSQRRNKLDTQTEGDDDPPNDGLGFELGFEGGHHASKLITQFGGKETDTMSCLAFAPSTGRRSRKRKTDWQARRRSNDFIKLEPYAVPCGNGWMKANPSKWEGYSFYTADLAIEKCLTVTYKMAAQPVLAFVGGLQFDVMPGPLATVDAQVCWPVGQRGQLSMMRTTIRSCGVKLFSRTLRLVKRFGSGTDFSSRNTFPSTATWARSANPRYAMSRSRLLETNSSVEQGATAAVNESEAMLEWETSTEDLYMASLDLGPDVGLKTHSELQGEAAAERLRGQGLSEDDLVGLSASGSSSLFQLFSFKHPGMINFELQGLLDGNSLELGMNMGFGPFSSEQKRLKLVDIVDQFSVTLNAVPFISSSNKEKALEALRGFSTNYFPPPVLTPGTVIALYNKHHRRFVKVITGNRDLGATHRTAVSGLRTDWLNEYFTVVDAGGGEIALHSSRFNRFVRMQSKTNMDMSGDGAVLPHGWRHERFIPVNAGNGEVALYCKAHRRFVQMRGDGHMQTKNQDINAQDLPRGWTHERFQIVQGHPYFYFEPGTVITIYHWKHKRFIQMESNGKLKRSGFHGPYVPRRSSWKSTYFTVVDAGDGLIALHNNKYNRFVKMTSSRQVTGTSTKDVLELPDNWNDSKYAVVPVGNWNHEIALHSWRMGRFISMSGHDIRASDSRKAQDIVGRRNWLDEKFKVYVVSRPSSPSSKSGAFEGARGAM